MRHARAVLAFAIAAAVLAGWAQAAAPQGATAAGDCTADGALDVEERAFLLLINAHRAENGRPPLRVSYTLSKAAQWKSQDMGANDYFAHDDLQRTWVQRIRDCGYGYNTWLGENIAAGVSSASAAFNLWKNSSGHNANMLSTNFATIGIGRAYTAGSPYGWYWTTEFGGYDDGYVTALTPPPTGEVDPGGAPTVRLTALRRGDSIVLRAQAHDRDGIARVEFFADGALIGWDATAPYLVRTPASARDLVAIAWDRAGNLSAAAPEASRSRR